MPSRLTSLQSPFFLRFDSESKIPDDCQFEVRCASRNEKVSKVRKWGDNRERLLPRAVILIALDKAPRRLPNSGQVIRQVGVVGVVIVVADKRDINIVLSARIP